MKLQKQQSSQSQDEDDEEKKLLIQQSQNLPVFQNNFDASLLSQILQDKFQSLFTENKGDKTMIVDQIVYEKLIKQIAPVKAIRDKIINFTKQPNKNQNQQQNANLRNEIALLDDIEYVNKNVQLIFLVSTEISILKKLANIIKETRKVRQNINTFDVIFWPERNVLCQIALQKLEVLEYIEIKDFMPDLIPLDSDLLSLELTDSFKQLYQQGDLSACKYVAHAIDKIQNIFGPIPNKFSMGKMGKHVLDILDFDQIEQKKKFEEKFETLILFDRSVDLITPLLSQTFYQGMIDDNFGIKGNYCHFSGEVFKQDNKPKEKRLSGLDQYYDLNYIKRGEDPNYTGDEIFSYIKTAPIPEAKKKIQEQMAQIKLFQQKSRQIDKKKIEFEEMNEQMKLSRQFLAQLPQIEDHIMISDKLEDIMKQIGWFKNIQLEQNILMGQDQNKTIEYCEILMAIDEPLHKIIQLLSLQSLCGKGIKQQNLERIEKQIVTTYGYSNLILIENLKQTQLLIQENQKGFQLFSRHQSSTNNENSKAKAQENSKTKTQENPEDIIQIQQQEDIIDTEFLSSNPIVQKDWNQIIESFQLIYEEKTYNKSDSKQQAKLNQLQQDIDQRQKAISKIYSLFTPLIGKLAEAAIIDRSWNVFTSFFKLLDDAKSSFIFPNNQDYVNLAQKYQQKRTFLVFFIGGVTYGEVAVLRTLAKLYDIEIIIATTNIINCQNLQKQLSFKPLVTIQSYESNNNNNNETKNKEQ